MLGFQAAPRLFSGQADEQFCLCSSEYEMSTCVIDCTNSHLFKGGGGGGGRDMRADSTSPGGEGRPEFFRVILSHDHSMFDLRKARAE